METITLSLISHTNVGKTTLARTLLGSDVGEVRDQSHVTEVSERHVLLETEGARLLLWDTPGFGDSARLLARLRREGNPVGWFLHQVWDRLRDRPLFSSQEALRNVREEADIVLYLVNATEHPEEAGYVTPELEILSFVRRPILALLNQTGRPGDGGASTSADWETFLSRWSDVRGLLELDAFSRSWVHERVFFQRLIDCLPTEKRGAMRALTDVWQARNVELFDATIDRMARALAETVADRESTRGSVAGIVDRKKAMAALAGRLAERERALWDEVLEDHHIEGRAAAELRKEIEDFEVQGAQPVKPKTGAVIGSVITGALGGLAADALSGGLTLGGGAIAGGLLGALGGAGLSRAYQLFGGEESPGVTWSDAALEDLARRMLVRYLAVAHFGRGRGTWREEEDPELWRTAAERVIPAEASGLEPRSAPDEAALEAVLRDVRAFLDRSLRALLDELYPGVWAD
ncbi:MAG: DUF3482 domain-containing protein [Planctomycetota bacterium]